MCVGRKRCHIAEHVLFRGATHSFIHYTVHSCTAIPVQIIALRAIWLLVPRGLLVPGAGAQIQGKVAPAFYLGPLKQAASRRFAVLSQEMGSENADL